MIPLTPELAEICGVICGDGHLSRTKSNKKTNYNLIICGHKHDDKDYMFFVQKLFNKATNKKIKFTNKKSYSELIIRSKNVLEMFENIGIPVGKKSNIVRIPKKIMKDYKLAHSFLRGFADADFSMVFRRRTNLPNYPRITVDIASINMIKDICKILQKIEISYCGPYTRKRISRLKTKYTTYQLDICGHRNFKLWMKYIGFNNYKHLKKIEGNYPQ